MMACDMCGKKGGNLNPLSEGYKTDEIQDICDDCERLVNNHVWKISRMNRKWMENITKTFMRNFKTR